MQITFILPAFLATPSGGFKVVYEYANRLQARGHEIIVIHPRNEKSLRGAVEFVKGRLWKYKLQLKYNPLIPWFNLHPGIKLLLVPDLSERFIPDSECIFATAYNTAFYVNSYSLGKGRKFYLIQSYETWQGSENKVRASWKLPLNKVVISSWLLKISHELGEADRTTYIPLGLDFSQFKITVPIRDRKIPSVGMLAHPNKIKGTKDGLTALKIAKERIPALRATFFGTHERDTDVPAWIDYVRTPSPKQLLDLYNSCQVFLHPSWIEGWGLPPAEAMACGCVLVASANEGVYEFAVEGKNAMLAPIKRPELLAEKLIEVIVNDDLRIGLAEAGHESIQRFTWDRAVDSLEYLLSR